MEPSFAPPPSGSRAKLSLAKVVGTPTKTAWAQVHAYAATDENKLKDRGQLIVALSLDLDVGEANAGLSSVDLGHEVITRLNEEYNGQDAARETPFELLKKSVESVASEFRDRLKLEICASVVWEGYIYFCLYGASKVYVSRGSQLSVILSGQNGQISTVSGEYQPDDLFILATSVFTKLIDQQTLSDLISRYLQIYDIADNITLLAHESSLPTLAVAMIRISGNQGAEMPDGEALSLPETPVTRNPVNPVSPMPRQSFFKNLLVKLAHKLPDEVNVKTYHFPQSGPKTAVSVGILLLALFSLSIGFGLKQKNTQDYKLSYQESLTMAANNYNEALAERDIDQNHSRELFKQAKQITDELAEKGVKDLELDKLRQDIAASAGDVLGEVAGDATIFLDLSIVRSGISGHEISLDGDTLAILDKEGQRLILRSTAKDTTVIGGPEKLKNPRSIAVYAGRYFVLTDDGVLELDKKGAVINTINPAGWGEIVKIGVFNGNLYVIDKTPQVWRYSGVEGEFGEKYGWLSAGAAPDFSNITDTAIDGSVWVITGDGAILKFTRGVPLAIRLSGLDKPMASSSAIYTDESLENFYLLDKSAGKILEFTKNGNYKKQYLAPQATEAIDFVVSKKAGKIFLLTPDKVLELSL